MSDNLQALSASMRPVDALSAAGLGQLSGLISPLQGVLDRLAGNASAVHSFVDAWTTVSQRIAQVEHRLSQSVATGTAEWQGASADKYRKRADDFAKSLAQFSQAAAAAAITARTTAQTVASGRSAANDLISDLVQRLISLVRQLMAAEGGMTATVLSQAGQLVSTFARPVATIEQQVQTTVSNATKPLTDITTVLSAITRHWDSYSDSPEPPPAFTLASSAYTVNNPIHFPPKPEPSLVTHELTHTTQQNSSQKK